MVAQPNEKNASRSAERHEFGCHMHDLLETGPPTPIEPVTDLLHGRPVADPYRWLEDQNSQRTRRWLGDQMKYFESYLQGLPDREGVRSRIRELLAVTAFDVPRKVGSNGCFLKREASQAQ